MTSTSYKKNAGPPLSARPAEGGKIATMGRYNRSIVTKRRSPQQRDSISASTNSGSDDLRLGGNLLNPPTYSFGPQNRTGILQTSNPGECTNLSASGYTHMRDGS
jgi:hypothetical protein